MRKELKSTDRTEGDINISKYRKKWIEENIDESTKELLAKDEKYFLHQSLSTPCMNVLTNCEGNFIYDNQGRSYFDFHGNNVHQVGYSNPNVIKAIINQIESLSFSPRRYTNKPAIKLAEKLVELTGNKLNKVLLAPGGTSVIGMALKLARRVTGKFKTISWWDSFHGASLDSVSVGGEALFRSNIGPLLPGTIHIPPPVTYNSPFANVKKSFVESIEYIEYVFEREQDISAFIAEPVRYTTVNIPDKLYWKKVRELCDKYNALLIFDEIPTCLGRSGKMFVYQNYDIVPDVVCIGKGLGGGIFPIAALLTKDVYDRNGDIALGHYTHEKSPVGSAAALATIETIESENLLKATVELGQYYRKRLNSLKRKHMIIGDIRNLGLMFAIELVKNRRSRLPAVDEADFILYEALKHGLSFKVSMGNIITLMPPLTITKYELDKTIGILSKCFVELDKEFGDKLNLKKRNLE